MRWEDSTGERLSSPCIRRKGPWQSRSVHRTSRICFRSLRHILLRRHNIRLLQTQALFVARYDDSAMIFSLRWTLAHSKWFPRPWMPGSFRIKAWFRYSTKHYNELTLQENLHWKCKQKVSIGTITINTVNQRRMHTFILYRICTCSEIGQINVDFSHSFLIQISSCIGLSKGFLPANVNKFAKSLETNTFLLNLTYFNCRKIARWRHNYIP